MIVSKDINISHPPTNIPSGMLPLISRTGTLKAEGSIGSEDDFGRVSGREKESKSDFNAKVDNADNMFIEDVSVSRPTERVVLTASALGPGHLRHQFPFR